MTTWYSLTSPTEIERLEEAWSDAPTDQPEICGMLLDIARTAVVSYAGWTAVPDVPSNLVYAQLQQAKNLWNAGRAQQDGIIGGEGYSFTPRPLDKTIRQLIRPRKGVPNVF